MITTTKMRATVLRAPDASPGLLMLNGQQRTFTLEKIWKAPVAPAANMTVEVELDASGAIHGITGVDGGQVARERLNQGASLARQTLEQLRTRMGTVMLAAAVVLWLAWFLLPGYSLDAGYAGSATYTPWQFIGLNLLPSGGVEISHGLWAMLGLLCIAAPFAVPYLKDARARYGNALPLACSLVALYAQRSSIIHALSSPGADASSALTMQSGSYLVLAAGAVLAWRGVAAVPRNLALVLLAGVLAGQLPAQVTTVQAGAVYTCPAALLKVYSCTGSGVVAECEVQAFRGAQATPRERGTVAQLLTALHACHLQTPAEARAVAKGAGSATESNGIRVGDQVEVITGFGWTPAKVLAIEGNSYRVLANGVAVIKDYPSEVRRLGPATAADHAHGQFRLGDRVLVNLGGQWVAGKVITEMGTDYQVEVPGNRLVWASGNALRPAQIK